MAEKPTYEELEQRVKAFENEALARKRAGEALLESEAQKAAILDGITTNLAFVNENLEILWANKTAADSVNRTVGEMVGCKCYELWADPNVLCEGCPTKRAFKTKRTELSTMHTPDGRVWEEKGEPVFDGKGGLLGVLEIAHDVTERKRTEAALQESEERFRHLADASMEAIFFTKDGICLEANQVAPKMFGYAHQSEFIGMSGTAIMAPESREVVEYHILNNIFEPYEAVGERKDGTHFPISIRAKAIPYKDRGMVRATSIMDITDREQAKEALRESEEKFRLISEQSLLAIGIIQDGHIKYANEMYSKITGYSLEEIYGWEPYGYARTVYKDDLPFVMEQSRKKQAGRKDVSPNYRFMGFTKAEDIVWWDLYSKTVNYHGRPADLFTLVDVTKNVKSEKERKTFEKQLQNAQKMEAIGTLAGGIAHDFNNLLMAVQGNTSLLLMDKDPFHPDFERLRGIEGHVESAAGLTRQLLAFARGGKYEVRPTDLNKLIKRESSMFGRTRKEISIHGTYEANLWPVAVDRGQIGQVLLNLYVNAWQAMTAGGNLHIRTQNTALDEKFAMPHDVEPGRYVRISVSDTGIGMDEAIRERIFDPFFTTKEMGRGTGMGLASVYGIVRNHGGFIRVDSEKGHGTTFNIYLPASEKEVVEEEKPAGETIMGSETVLFVDDEDMVAEIARDLLERLGYEVLTAGSGKDAIEIYQENRSRIDMVVLDMIMPDMGGGDTYDGLKKLNPEVKVLLSSGYSIDGQATEILDRGCNGFIQKPFKMKKLSRKLREILSPGPPA
ncbi:MAG: PAS domain S-box protein [Deltaproteobacteria bacterium]|nr:PAS domain S-box protein [Deltaproteobacteria bacterium]